MKNSFLGEGGGGRMTDYKLNQKYIERKIQNITSLILSPEYFHSTYNDFNVPGEIFAHLCVINISSAYDRKHKCLYCLLLLCDIISRPPTNCTLLKSFQFHFRQPLTKKKHLGFFKSTIKLNDYWLFCNTLLEFRLTTKCVYGKRVESGGCGVKYLIHTTK